MNKEEVFLLEKEVSRLLSDFSRCKDADCKELIRQDVIFLSKVIANNEFL